VRLREPGWWYGAPDAAVVRWLQPLSHLYAAVAEQRFKRATAFVAPVPVICVGNFTAGGTGKTPFTALLAGRLTALGETPVILSRGYGGRIAGPHWVVPGRDTSAEVGDEPLLLAQYASVLIARDRAAGARAIAEGPRGATVILMDDGLQNPGLKKDLSFAIVDGARGFGNGQPMPSGPLRARLAFQYGLVDAMIVNHGSAAPDASTIAKALRVQFTGPVLDAGLQADDNVALNGKPVVAYAGIGAPERFFATLRALGADVRHTVPFADHYAFQYSDAARLLSLARNSQAMLVTTEKDKMRLQGAAGALADLDAASTALRVSMTLPPRDMERLDTLLTDMLHRTNRRAHQPVV
jgi:tetraacyldisaccharide 4'-kinase